MSTETLVAHGDADRTERPWIETTKGRRGRMAIQATMVVAVLAVGAFAFNAMLPDSIHYDGSGDAPIYTFPPMLLPNSGNVVRPIPGHTFTESGPNILISKNSPAFEFSRWFQGQGVNFTATETLAGTIPPVTPVVTGMPFQVTYLNLTGPDVSSATPVNWTNSANVSRVIAPPLPIHGSGLEANHFNGNSTVNYVFQESTFESNYYAFAFNMSQANNNGTNIIHVESSEGFIAVVLYPDEPLVVYAGSITNGKYMTIPLEPVVLTQDTGYVIVHPSPKSLWIDVSGKTAQIPNAVSGANNVTFRIGVPFRPNGSSFAFSGNATKLYSSPSNFTLWSQGSMEVSTANWSEYMNTSTPQFSVSLSSSAYESDIRVNNELFSIQAPTTSLGFGKYVYMPYTVNIVVQRMWVTQFASDNYTLLPVFAFTVTPYMMMTLAAREMRARTRQDSCDSSSALPKMAATGLSAEEKVSP